jgi:dienelactone hydrolase
MKAYLFAALAGLAVALALAQTTRHVAAPQATPTGSATVTSAAPPLSPPASPSHAPAPAPTDVDAAAGAFTMTYTSDGYRLHGDVMKPQGAGPFPAIVYNHGSEADPSLATFKGIGTYFQAAGYVVIFPYRRGSTGSEGPYWRDEVDKRPEAQRSAATVEQLEAHSHDVLAAIRWVAELPYVDRTHIAVAGCSFGGIETVLAASMSPDVYAAVDFAGASMSWAGSPPLQERLVTAARAARVPIFFLQAENDYDTTPSRVLSSEMEAAGKPSTMKIFPRFGASKMAGHGGFCTMGMGSWGSDVLAFLRAPRAARLAP